MFGFSREDTHFRKLEDQRASGRLFTAIAGIRL